MTVAANRGLRSRTAVRLLLLIALAALGPAAAVADAATYALRPTKTYLQNGWTVAPFGSTAFGNLADSVLQPAAPGTSTGYVVASTSGSASNWQYTSTAVGVQGLAPAAGETIKATTAWVYAKTGAQQMLWVSLWAGNTVVAYRSFPAGQGPAWFAVPTPTPLTAAQLGALSVMLTSDGTAGASNTNAYAAYVEVGTDPPPAVPGAPAPPATTGTPTPGGLVDFSKPPVVSINLAPVTVVVARGRALTPVSLGCPANALGGCHGTVTIARAGGGTPPKHKLAVQARCGRGCRNLGHAGFQIAAGRRRKVRVPMAFAVSKLFGRAAAIKVKITVTSYVAAKAPPTITSAVVSLKRPAGR